MTKVTVNMLDKEIKSFKSATATNFAGVHKRVDETNGNVEKLDKAFKDVKDELEELRRAKRGTTSSHARIAALETEFQKYVAGQNKIKDDTSDDPAVQTANQKEFARLDQRLEALFGRVTEEQSSIREELDSLSAKVSGHEVRLDMLDEGQQSLNGRVNHVAHRVTILERLRDSTPWGRIVIAAVLGVVASIIWAAIPFTQTYPKADGTPVTVPLDAAESPWAAFGAGIFAFGLVLGLLMLFSRSRQLTEQYHEVQPIPVAPHPVTAPYAEDTAPTKAFPAQGAPSSTR